MTEIAECESSWKYYYFCSANWEAAFFIRWSWGWWVRPPRIFSLLYPTNTALPQAHLLALGIGFPSCKHRWWFYDISFFFSFSRKTFDVQHICKFMLYRLSYFNRKEFLFVLLQREGRTGNPHVVAHRNDYRAGPWTYGLNQCLLIKFYRNIATSVCWHFLWLLLS